MTATRFQMQLTFGIVFRAFPFHAKDKRNCGLQAGFCPLAKSISNIEEMRYAFTAHIRPARLEVRNKNGNPTGETAEYYPCAREELIEHALRKMAVEQYAGFFDKTDFRSSTTNA